MTTITAAQLKREGACREWVDVMELTFPKGMPLTLKNFNKLIRAFNKAGDYLGTNIAFLDIYHSSAARRVLGAEIDRALAELPYDFTHESTAKTIRTILRKRDARRAKK